MITILNLKSLIDKIGRVQIASYLNLRSEITVWRWIQTKIPKKYHKKLEELLKEQKII